MNNMNIVPAKKNIVPLNVQLANDIKTLSQDIAVGQYELQNTLDNLESSSLDIEIKRNFLGCVKKNSIEKSFENVYSNLSYYIGECGKALQHTNENLGRTIDLIKLLALVEKDLYDQLDYQYVASNEIKTILADWFKKQGIKDEDIQELLEASFQRAYTLRDRLNSLRQEYRENIALCMSKMKVFEEKYISLDNEIAIYIKNTKDALQNALDNNKRTFETLYNEKYSILDALAKNKEQNLKDIADRFYKRIEAEKNILSGILTSNEKILSKIVNKGNDFNSLAQTKCNELFEIKKDSEKEIKELVTKKEDEIVNKLSNSYNEYFERITKISTDTQNEIEEKKQIIETSIDDAKIVFDNNLQKHNETLVTIRTSLMDEFQNKIREQTEMFEQEKSLLMSSFKKRIIRTLIGSVAISSVIAYFISTFVS